MINFKFSEGMKKTRRTFSASMKAEIALEAIKGIKTISEISQLYEVHPTQVTQWKREFLERAGEVFEGEKRHRDELDRLRQEREELFKQIGELRFENSWYKKKLKS